MDRREMLRQSFKGMARLVPSLLGVAGEVLKSDEEQPVPACFGGKKTVEDAPKTESEE